MTRSLTNSLRGRHEGHGAPAPRSTAELRPAGSPGKRTFQAGLPLVGALLWMVVSLLYAAPVSAQVNIVNTVQIQSNSIPLAESQVTVQKTAVSDTPVLEFLKYAPLLSTAQQVVVSPTWYSTTGNSKASFSMMPPPVPAGSTTPIDLTKPVPLTPTTIFHQCEPIFVRLTDQGSNLDPAVADSAVVTLTDPATGDVEVLRLSETGADTGVFTGYIQSSGSACQVNPAPGTYSGYLPVTDGSKITAVYTSTDGTETVNSVAVVDPYGIIFNSITGKPVDGVSITLIDDSTGQPADDPANNKIFGDDGVATFPATIVTGSTTTDTPPAGKPQRTYDFPPGQFRYPFVKPGSYRFQIKVPAGYSLPSTVPDATLQKLPTGPFALTTGSRGGGPVTAAQPTVRLEPFTVNPGPAMHIDIPIDPLPASLWLVKSTGKALAAIGDFVPYQLDLTNNDQAATAINLSITDTLPPGFRYRPGSTTGNGVRMADPALSADGRTMVFTLADLAPKASVSIRYVVEVAAGAHDGAAINTATARSYGTASNTAQATVMVHSDFMNSKSLIMGRVERGPCGLDWDEGVEGIRIYLEDGTFVNTDKRGMFHFEGVKPGTHVIQLDLDSLPEGYQVYSCSDNSRFAGRSFSQFVDAQGGTMWRADFRVGRPDDVALYQKRATEKAEAAKKKADEAAMKITEARLAELKRSAEAAASAKAEAEEVEPPKDDWAPEQAGGEPEPEVEQAAKDDWSDPQPEEAPATVVENSAPDAIALELRSRLEEGGVILTPTVELSRLPARTRALEVELPAGLRFRAGSATRGGRQIPDPAVTGRVLSFPLENGGAGERVALRFAADFTPEAPSGEFITRATVAYSGESGKVEHTVSVDNVLVRIKAQEAGSLPSLVVRPTFEVFEATLSPEDKKTLDATAETIRNFTAKGLMRVRQLLVVGHTDWTRIAPRSRKVYRDNIALSQARARSVALYLKEKLGLTPAQISASGKGQSVPVASNKTAEGRSLNRRVEVTILTEQVVERVSTKITKDADRASRKIAGEGSASAVPRSGPAAAVVSGAPAAKAARAKSAGAKTAVAPAGAESEESETSDAAGSAAGSAGSAGAATAGAAYPVSGSLFPGFPAARGLAGFPLLAANLATPATAAAGGYPLPLVSESSAMMSVPASESESEVCYLAAAAAVDSPKEPVKTPRLTEVGIMSPADGFLLPDPISAVRVVLDSQLTPHLLVDGSEISAERIGFTLKDNTTEKTLYSYIGVNFGDPGQHTIVLRGTDTFGNVRFEKSAKVTRVGAIATIRVVGTDGNVADGKSPVKVRLELFDAAGTPFRSATQLSVQEGNLKPYRQEAMFKDPADKGDKVTVDSDGWALFQPVNASGPYRAVLAAGKTAVEVETYVQPKMRDWILVGLGEETVGYNTVTGHMENFKASGEDNNLYEDGRIAFYGKGTIQGKWLLTMAYDSAKQNPQASNSLFQTINPETYYTLYGDASQQQFDAASARKVYLKIEREQFYALFGDFDTGLTVTELSRYSRRLNGVKAEWQGKKFEANVFGTNTAQAYARDEIQGDGTSGLYHLSRKPIVLNSDKVTIQVRDRFRSEIIVSSQDLARYTDYTIDYDAGTIFFKQPIPSRDENFNPIFIVAEYEVNNQGTEALTYGGRVGAKLLDNKLKTGFTYIHEGQITGSANSYGVDATARLATGTTLKGEAAHTDTDYAGDHRHGDAFLAEVQQQSRNFVGRAYFREEENGFGLGQQNGSENGTRKFGAEGNYKLSDSFTVGGQAYRQYNLATGGYQDIVEERNTYTQGPYSAHVGARYANDTQGDGTTKESDQLNVGGSWLTLNKRLTLRADHDQSIGGNANATFPTRTVVGADFKLTDKVTLTADQEFTSGDGANTNNTRVGLKSMPWSGGSLNSSLERDTNDNGQRMFALFGLKQTWKVTDKWSVDGSLDRSQTMAKSSNYTLNTNVPAASGSSEDFTAVSLGTNYTEKSWNTSNRVEYRTSTSEDKWGIVSSFIGEPKEGWGWSARLQLYDSKSITGGTSINDDLRLGLVYRPRQTRWIILDRLDVIYSNTDAPGSISQESRRLVNNLNANLRLLKSEISLQYGAKYVLETIDSVRYSGYTDLFGIEGRYDLAKDWDLGIRGSVLHSWGVGQVDYSTGVSLGYNIVQNAWLSLGYNLMGFTDKDFSASDYTAQGPYLKFRFKFDQSSVKDAAKWLNR
ncbi:hypothetical protein GMSM_35230 [Geomonas sp. Red276]